MTNSKGQVVAAAWEEYVSGVTVTPNQQRSPEELKELAQTFLRRKKNTDGPIWVLPDQSEWTGVAYDGTDFQIKIPQFQK